MNRVLYYDAYCVLCNKFIAWMIKHDPKGLYKFAALDSTRALKLKAAQPELAEIDSVILEIDGKTFTHGSAVRKVIQDLSTSSVLKRLLGFYPDFLLLFGYKLVASSRYQIFGKYDVCPPLPPEWRGKFIDE